MSLSRPRLADPAWTAWLARFPGLPDRNRFDLAWTRNRLSERIAALPPTLPGQGDRNQLRRWLSRFGNRFSLDQQDDIALFDPVAVIGVVSLLIGAAATSVVPPLSIGAFGTSAGLLGKAIANNRDARLRAKLVKAIKLQLQEIDEIL